MGQVFSVPIFIILFRETIEAAIIISVLLSLVENLADQGDVESSDLIIVESARAGSDPPSREEESKSDRKRRLVKRMRWQVWAGALTGLAIAVCIGAAFIAVFFTTLSNIWSKAEEIWEGTFSLIASIIIFIMGVTMLRIDRAKLKWQKKLEGAFDKSPSSTDPNGVVVPQKGARSGKWSLFLLPLITVLREGLEAVVFVGGVSLGQTAKAIPLAAITGLICGFIIGYLIYASGNRLNLTMFLVVSTNVLFLLGAGLLSKAVWKFQVYSFNRTVGKDVEELGLGPGSYDVRGNVWHLTYGNPENNLSGEGWSVFNAVLGWTNSATIGSILSYVIYWLAVIATLTYMKWSEGRTSFFGFESAAGKRRIERAQRVMTPVGEKDDKLDDMETASVEGRPTLKKNDHGSVESEDEKKSNLDEIALV